jgi:hypothetical protein
MAGKISELTVDNTPLLSDIIEYTTDPGGTPLSRSTTLTGLFTAFAEYAEISANAAGTPQTTINSSTYTKIDQFDTDGPSAGATPSQANNQITIGTAGIYQVSVSISFSGTASETFTVAVFDDGVVVPDTLIIRKLGTGGDVGRVAGTTLHNFGAGSVLDLRVISLAGSGDTFAVESGAFSIHRIA